MNKKKNTNKYNQKINKRQTSLLVAAALSVTLLGVQISPVLAREEGTRIEKSAWLPDNITISEPMALSDITLPGSEYGTLSWADGSFVPTERVQSCEVILYPAEAVNLSNVDGWDEEAGGVIGYVNVVVSGIESSEDTDSGEDTEQTEDTQKDQTDKDDQHEDQEGTDISDPSPIPEDTEAPEEILIPEDPSVPQTTVTPAEEETADPAQKEEEEDASDGKDDPDEKEDSKSDSTDGKENQDNTDSDNEQQDIFDRKDDETEKDDRPVSAEDNLTDEEKEERAEINHNCNGISVSGINLPWYVQFRVTNGDSYQFTNESDATIFQSYEFELWDLQNNTEYEIPDGEYISVTVPVKAGYEYTIEHILDNGAMETIIPSVEGDMMVFSTHSFSPFGIAGSKPIVDSDITQDGYSGNDSNSGAASLTPTPGVQGQNSNTTNGVSVKDETNQQQTSSGAIVSSSGNTESSGSDAADDSENNSPADTNDVNTGDNTPILPFVVLVAAAAAIIIAVIVMKKKKK